MLIILRDLGHTIYDLFVMPGEWVLSQLVAHAPVLAASLGISAEEGITALPIILSLLAWMMLAVVVRKLFKLCTTVARITSSALRTISFRMSLSLHNLKTMIVCKFQRLLFWRGSDRGPVIAEVELNNLDLAVLRSASARGSAFALSAPELAEQFALRPAQVQRSLDKLNRNKLLASVIGSTDGFDNYRLTDSGIYFLAMWQRQELASNSRSQRQSDP